MQQYYTLSDVARTLRTRPYRIVYLLTSGQVPEPAMRLGSRRIFQYDDLLRLADRLQIQIDQEVQAKGQGGSHD